ncbi:hypothetical protein QWZ04_19585 [Vibrio tapetis subsp. quintayensis]|uniref:hypothetical protein n=1 Tax=Vibrio tapetis TaxID=52443 RepID=UPI0025B5ABE4|nr:hypothetical protein [Vibrio tapetis]MDN3682512.1 hypothetical protein [Vibrio tapetis subsp. quintayensis]
MKKIDAANLEYKGESNGVHNWTTSSGQPYYWHPDWLHIAEDATGSHPKQALEVADEEAPNKEHAVAAILKHVNDWAKSKLSNNPDIESSAIEAQMKLKK